MRIFFLILLSFFTQQSSAALSCYFTPNSPSIVNFVLPQNITITPNLALGAVLWQSSALTSAGRPTSCNQNWYAVTAYANDNEMKSTDVAGVYATNVPGIGIQVLGYNTPLPAPGSSKSFAYYGPAGVNAFLSLQIKLIKTGPISAGTVSLPINLLGGGYASESSTTLLNAYPYGLANVTGSTVITLPTCSSSDVTVSMGSVSVNEFSRIGDTARTTFFQIPLNNCPAGWKNVHYQIRSITKVISANGIVGLSASSTATGVGIRILDANNIPLTAATGFNAFSPLGTASNKPYNATVGGNYTLKFSAQYYQTDAGVGAGTADSMVEFITGYD